MARGEGKRINHSKRCDREQGHLVIHNQKLGLARKKWFMDNIRSNFEGGLNEGSESGN